MSGKEMTAVEYLKAKERMTKGCTIFCRSCPFGSERNGRNYYCVEFQYKYAEEAVAMVQKWAEENPVKTRMSDFFEKHPKARTECSLNRYPSACACIVGYVDMCECSDCEECWSRPLEE